MKTYILKLLTFQIVWCHSSLGKSMDIEDKHKNKQSIISRLLETNLDELIYQKDLMCILINLLIYQKDLMCILINLLIYQKDLMCILINLLIYQKDLMCISINLLFKYLTMISLNSYLN